MGRHSRVLVIASVLCSLSGAGEAQGPSRRNADWETATALCDPACREGYECSRGECVPQCVPACEPGYLCSAEVGCVRVESAPRAPSSRRPAPQVFEPSDDGCDPGCRSGYGCMAGRCVSLCNPSCAADELCTVEGECAPRYSFSREPPPSATETIARDRSADAVFSVLLDVAGVLQFGVTPKLEIGKRFSGFIWVRSLNTGLASYFLLGRDRDDELHFGLGGGLGLHFFSADTGNMRGWYGGLALEYVYLETRDVVRDYAQYRTHAFVPQFDFGHRWVLGSLLLGVSLKLGLAIPFADRARGIGPDGCAYEDSCRKNLGMAFFPGIGLDLGWLIPL